MCTSPNIPERRKTPPLRGRLVKWEYTNAVSKITLSVCLADDGIVRVTYFTGPVPEDEPSYAVSPGYSAPGSDDILLWSWRAPPFMQMLQGWMLSS